MNYIYHLTLAKSLLSLYKGDEPFNFYLKKYFRYNKKHGSRDRKLISALCYNYFRLGFSFKEVDKEEKILNGFFLCENKSSAILQSLRSEWNKSVSKSLEEKLIINNWQSEIEKIFPFKDELSEEIAGQKFSISFLQQPKLFIRLRPKFESSVLKKLKTNNLIFERPALDCIALPNSSGIDSILNLDKEAVVQDYNSQRIGELIKKAIANKSEIDVWDCCAGSGGKSIMAYDINPSINLTVSDKRKSILKNLDQRFKKAEIKNYSSFVIDLTEDGNAVSKNFDLVIADVPCTGSGTWSRTPEQLCYFDKKEISRYGDLQKKIIQNASARLKSEGYLLYVTCSVFKKENEEVVKFIKEKLKLSVIQMNLFKGYEMHADTLFAALFKL